jgi:aldose 1-epimerase
LRISAHDWTLELLPALGGAIGALKHAGVSVLRPAQSTARAAHETAYFPLVPYANRIANGRLEHGAQIYPLPLNFGDDPHSLRGLGWQAAWLIESAGTNAATLVHRHDGGAGWSRPYRAEQCFELTPHRFTVSLSIENLADTPMPAGLGLHPYSQRNADTRLRFAADHVWLADAGLLPTTPAPADTLGCWSRGSAIEGISLIDNTYQGWAGTALIEQSWGTLAIEAHGAPFVHLYRPPGSDFFCLEPVITFPMRADGGRWNCCRPGRP